MSASNIVRVCLAFYSALHLKLLLWINGFYSKLFSSLHFLKE